MRNSDHIGGSEGVFASLPWYELPETRLATDALWRRLRRRLRLAGFAEAPPRLERTVCPREQWRSGRLLISQACGYDAAITFPSHLRVISAPRYGATGCEGSFHRSWIVVRESSGYEIPAELRGARAAINEPSSHSGMNALRAVVAPYHRDGRFFSDVVVSGSHCASLALIRQHRVDVAAIDCVTWALIERHRRLDLAGLRVLCETPAVPAPPFVTAAFRDPGRIARLRAALEATLRDPGLAAARDQLLLSGVAPVTRGAYRRIVDLRDRATSAGYLELPPRRPTPLPLPRPRESRAAPDRAVTSPVAG